jgi:WS/DGAT/MGAT family acyltransferase
MPTRERMSGVDTAWLRMDRPHNLMMIVGVWVLDGPPDARRLQRAIAERFACFARLRQYPVLDATGAWWETDERFALRRHLHRVKLPGRAGPPELRRLVARLASSPLPAGKPLWEFHLAENYSEGPAVIARLHHCYADGIALMRVMLSMTDASPAGLRRAPPPHEADGHGPLWQLLEPVSEVVSGAVRLSGTVLDKYFELLRDPGHLVEYAKMAQRAAADVVELATMPDDSPTRFKGKPGTAKRVAWTGRMPLVEVKAVGQALGCSVNDVLLSCVAGALRGYLLEHGDDPHAVEIRALVPVNLRAPHDQGLGNWFGLVPLLLPLGIANPLARLYEVSRRMDALKGSYLAPISLGLLAGVGLMPKPLQQQVLDILANKASAVMTNLPGPQQPLYFAGRRLEQLMFWVPQSGDIGMGVSILSYAGGVQFGLITDAGLVPDPERIAQRFAVELERLVTVVMMEPWGARRDPLLVERELAASSAPAHHAAAHA